MEQVHQLIFNMIVTKDLSNKVLYYIYPLGENLEYITWAIREFYRRNIQTTLGIAVFGRYMILNLASVVDCQVITAGKQQRAEIYNVQENARRVMHDYTIEDLVYVEMTGTDRKLDYKKQGPYRMT